MAKDTSISEVDKSAVDPAPEKPAKKADKGTLYVFPNFDGKGKAIRVVAKDRDEAIKLAKQEVKGKK